MFMRNSNICKFTFAEETASLTTYCFVRESDFQSMSKPVTLSHHCVILITQGKGTFLFSNNSFPLKRGGLVFGFKSEHFAVKPQENLEYMYIHFEGSRAEELFRRFGISNQNRLFGGFDGIIPLWQDTLAGANENTIDLASESVLLYTFARLFKSITPRDTLISKILKISEENFTDPALSLTSIADTLGYNSKYISHLFKKALNVTYSEHLRNLRIQYAVSLLDHGLDSVKNVALLSGFTDPLYFSTVFKKSLGLSPTEYISRIKK